MLRKMTVLGVSLLVLTGIVSGAAARSPRPPRTESHDYVAGGVNGLLGVGAKGYNVGAVWFTPGKERFISVTIDDDHASGVWGRVAQDLNGDDFPEVTHDFCGATDEPVRIRPHFEVVVLTYAGVCPLANTPSTPTSGTVTGTFSTGR